MSELVQVPLSQIDANPHRRLKSYPFIDSKIEALRQSIATNGLWEGIIARKRGNRFQIAFGHHRLEAARLELGKNAMIGIIERSLDDAQMLRFMANENLEDYNNDFLVVLEVWEAAEDYLLEKNGPVTGQLETRHIAEFLGWQRTRDDRVQPSHVAQGCAAANALIKDGTIKREALVNLSLHAARQLCQGAAELARRVEKQIAEPNAITTATKQIGKAVTKLADDIREKKTTTRNITGKLHVKTYEYAAEAKRAGKLPVFEKFVDELADKIDRTLVDDSLSERLEAAIKGAADIARYNEGRATSRLASSLEKLGGRAEDWAQRFRATKGATAAREIHKRLTKGVV